MGFGKLGTDVESPFWSRLLNMLLIPQTLMCYRTSSKPSSHHTQALLKPYRHYSKHSKSSSLKHCTHSTFTAVTEQKYKYLGVFYLFCKYYLAKEQTCYEHYQENVSLSVCMQKACWLQYGSELLSCCLEEYPGCSSDWESARTWQNLLWQHTSCDVMPRFQEAGSATVLFFLNRTQQYNESKWLKYN